MTKTVYLIAAVPAAGKSWVCEQLKTKFEYVHHDGFIGHINQPEAYVAAVLEKAGSASRPILAEAPFSISSIKDPLEARGFNVIPVFILEEESTLRKRWAERGRTEEHIIKGHLSRQKTFKERCRKWRAFSGNSSQVFTYLKELSL